jgi:drug/metabolite transporter (DMT)-like permease
MVKIILTSLNVHGERYIAYTTRVKTNATGYALLHLVANWKRTSAVHIFCCDLQGTIASGFCLFLGCWSNHKGGPILVAAYSPTQSVFSTLFGVLFLGNALFLGR